MASLSHSKVPLWKPQGTVGTPTSNSANWEKSPEQSWRLTPARKCGDTHVLLKHTATQQQRGGDVVSQLPPYPPSTHVCMHARARTHTHTCMHTCTNPQFPGPALCSCQAPRPPPSQVVSTELSLPANSFPIHPGRHPNGMQQMLPIKCQEQYPSPSSVSWWPRCCMGVQRKGLGSRNVVLRAGMHL